MLQWLPILLLKSFFVSDSSDTMKYVYFNSNFEAESEMEYVTFMGLPKRLYKNKYEITFYTLDGNKVAFGEYKGHGLKNKSGVFVRYFPDGSVASTAVFKKSLLTGVYQRYFSNGVLADSGLFWRNYSKGIWKTWHYNGQLMNIRNYTIRKGRVNINSLLDGEYKSWFSSGKLKDSGFFKLNEREGVWLEYLEEGEIKSIGQYKNNWKIGDWKFYDKNGKLLYLRRYKKYRYDAVGERIEIKTKQ